MYFWRCLDIFNFLLFIIKHQFSSFLLQSPGYPFLFIQLAAGQCNFLNVTLCFEKNKVTEKLQSYSKLCSNTLNVYQKEKSLWCWQNFSEDSLVFIFLSSLEKLLLLFIILSAPRNDFFFMTLLKSYLFLLHAIQRRFIT